MAAKLLKMIRYPHVINHAGAFACIRVADASARHRHCVDYILVYGSMVRIWLLAHVFDVLCLNVLYLI